jgi:hypothetical protein
MNHIDVDLYAILNRVSTIRPTQAKFTVIWTYLLDYNFYGMMTLKTFLNLNYETD